MKLFNNKKKIILPSNLNITCPNIEANCNLFLQSTIVTTCIIVFMVQHAYGTIPKVVLFNKYFTFNIFHILPIYEN